MISYAEALRVLAGEARTDGLLPAETVPLPEAAGRVCAEEVRSGEALPPFDNSSMDGYAVRAARTSGASARRPLTFTVAAASAAGDRPRSTSRAQAAFEISTGAPLPRGLDAVVRLEDVTVTDGGRTIALTAPASRGDYVRRAGRDFRMGTPVLGPGMRVEPRHLLALAALGQARVSVRRRPLVALLSTGRELVEPGEKPAPGQIRNATAAYLAAALPLAGARVRYHGIASDDPRALRRRLEAVLADGPDAVVTTGAVSVGRHDHVAAAAAALGAAPLYHKVAIRPGKPGLLARFPGGPLLFGFPGNPVSTVAAARFFLLPYLRARLGEPAERPLPATLAARAEKPEGLRCFFKARVRTAPGGLSVSVLAGQASFQIRPLLAAGAWAILPEAGSALPAGAEVSVLPLWPGRELLG